MSKVYDESLDYLESAKERLGNGVIVQHNLSNILVFSLDTHNPWMSNAFQDVLDDFAGTGAVPYSVEKGKDQPFDEPPETRLQIFEDNHRVCGANYFFNCAIAGRLGHATGYSIMPITPRIEERLIHLSKIIPELEEFSEKALSQRYEDLGFAMFEKPNPHNNDFHKYIRSLIQKKLMESPMPLSYKTPLVITGQVLAKPSDNNVSGLELDISKADLYTVKSLKEPRVGTFAFDAEGLLSEGFPIEINGRYFSKPSQKRFLDLQNCTGIKRIIREGLDIYFIDDLVNSNPNGRSYFAVLPNK